MEATGNHGGATTHYQQALKLHPADKDLWVQVSTFHARAREWDAAVECQRKALALDPENKILAKTLGMHLARAGRYEESFTCLKPVVGEAEAHSDVARMLHHVGQEDAARQHAELALQINPQLPSARDLLTELDAPLPPPGTAAAAAPTE